MTSAPIDLLLEVLDLRSTGPDVFVGASRDVDYTRFFGGQVAAQALVAAGRTVQPDRQVHSLHAYFLRAGDPRHPVEFQVERMRDGRGFSVRRVIAVQHGRVTFTLAASFHVEEVATIEHTTRAPEVPRPDGLRSFKSMIEPHLDYIPPIVQDMTWPVDVRPVRGFGERFAELPHPGRPGGADEGAHALEGDYPGEDLVWFRADGPMPDDPHLHACVATNMSDTTALDAVTRRHGRRPQSAHLAVASLDHAMWFHKPFRADHWSLYSTASPAAGRGLGFSRGLMFDDAGDLTVSITQEGMFRTLTPPGAPLPKP